MPELQKLRGKAWVFQGLLDADKEICPLDIVLDLRDKGLPITEQSLGQYCMTKLDPDFPKKVQPGDFIVGGESTGYTAACLDGDPEDPHALAYATKSILGTGVAAVLCESCNFVFLRNSLDHGLPIVECKGVMEKVRQGDELEIDLHAGLVKNLTTGEEMSFPILPDFILETLAEGGVYAQLAARQAQEG